jgi:hypothetical protein
MRALMVMVMVMLKMKLLPSLRQLSAQSFAQGVYA